MSQLSNDDRRILLEIARRAVSTAVLEKRLPDLLPETTSVSASGGAFVTLHRNGQLRGCVGQIEDCGPLVDAVARAAINAALHDYRFPPVTAEEVETLEIEISVLSQIDPIAPEAVIVGRHGLIVIKGENRGLLLPQVAQERRWSSERFLEETCAKAGLPRDAWRGPSIQVLAFTAEVFSESNIQALSTF